MQKARGGRVVVGAERELLIRLDMGMAIGAGLRKPGCTRDRWSEVVVTLKGMLLCHGGGGILGGGRGELREKACRPLQGLPSSGHIGTDRQVG
jgi:hypothetical protein